MAFLVGLLSLHSQIPVPPLAVTMLFSMADALGKIRHDELAYLDQFYDTGAERTRK